MSKTGLRCDCGGWITITTDRMIGITIEECSGPCDYRGAPRPAPFFVPQYHIDHTPKPVVASTKMCPDCNERPTYTPNAHRCRECADVRHQGQLNEANRRFWHARKKAS